VRVKVTTTTGQQRLTPLQKVYMRKSLALARYYRAMRRHSCNTCIHLRIDVVNRQLSCDREMFRWHKHGKVGRPIVHRAEVVIRWRRDGLKAYLRVRPRLVQQHRDCPYWRFTTTPRAAPIPIESPDDVKRLWTNWRQDNKFLGTPWRWPGKGG